MKRVSMIATQRMRYGALRLKPGDAFMASSDAARLFRAIRWARDADPAADAIPEARPEPPRPEQPKPARARTRARRLKDAGE